MKQRYNLIVLTILMVLSACQPAATPQFTPTPIPDTATPSITPSPIATDTSTPTATPTLALPVSAGTAFPFEPVAISVNNASRLKELLRFISSDIQVFDGVKTSANLILDTSHGVLITDKSGKILKTLPSARTYCNSNLISINQDLFIGNNNEIGIIGYDQIQVYSPDGEKLLYFLPLQDIFINPDELSFWGEYCPKDLHVIRFSSDMKTVAIGYNSSDLVTNIYDITTQTLITSLENILWPRMFSPDGKYLVVEKPNRQIALYQTSDWVEVGLATNNETIYSMGFSPNGKYLFVKPAAIDYYPYIYVFNIEDKTRTKIPYMLDNLGWPVLFSQNDQIIVASRFNEASYAYDEWEVWDLITKRRVEVVSSYTVEQWKEPIEEFNSIYKWWEGLEGYQQGYYSFNQVYFSSKDNAISLFTTSLSGSTICTFYFNGKKVCEQIATRDERKFVHDSGDVFTMGKAEKSWELYKGNETAQTKSILISLSDIPSQDINYSPVPWFEITPDGKTVIYETRINQQTISVRNIGTDAKILTRSGDGVRSLLVNPYDNRYVAFFARPQGQCSAVLWNIQNDSTPFSFEKECKSVAPVVSFASNHEFVYIRLSQNPVEKWKTVGTVYFYDYEKGEETRSFDVELVHQNIFSLAFSPDGKILALGLTDGMILLLDAETGQLLHSWRGHNGEVDTISFSKDGTKMLTFGGVDYYAKIWGVLP